MCVPGGVSVAGPFLSSFRLPPSLPPTPRPAPPSLASLRGVGLGWGEGVLDRPDKSTKKQPQKTNNNKHLVQQCSSAKATSRRLAGGRR